ncbi:MAG TPA: APC family permease [Acidobacteriaceae bacterium]|jgi:amino acid transporter|nr:APC family permease [Acidobacteriaceae bacterium]
MVTSPARAAFKKLRLLPLVAATYYMVAGGPYGLEDIIGNAGYRIALLLLLLLPFLWSLPTALMIGELASSIPAEGGFYAWVRRALGPFWGFQEAWLSLAASVFDMAIYPTIFVDYLSRIAPGWTAGHRGLLLGLLVVAIAAVWNLRGAASVGEGSAAMMFLSLSPFAVLIGLAIYSAVHTHTHAAFSGRPIGFSFSGALLVALWNYMGWDNASTVALEVEDPQRNYPRAMLTSALMVMLVYCLPLLAIWIAGVAPGNFTTGSWVNAAALFGGSTLALAVVIAGSLDGLGTFTSLTMSYTRLPYAMAEDGLLPKLFTRRLKNGAPWVSILVCAGAWALALQFTFERLITMDLVLYGLSLILEFVALIVLRRREPELHRPFRVPGGIFGAVAVGLGPTALILYALYAARGEHIGAMPALVFATLVACSGAVLYLIAKLAARAGRQPAQG